MGVAGMIPATTEFLRRLRDVTARQDIVLIYDEVVTFPVAYGGAQAHYGVLPDLTTLSKSIGGGLPLGAVGGRAEIMNLLEPKVNNITLALNNEGYYLFSFGAFLLSTAVTEQDIDGFLAATERALEAVDLV